MKNLKQFGLIATTMFFAVILTSCGGGMSGTYVPKNDAAKEMPLTKIVFDGGTVKIYMGVPSLAGMPQIDLGTAIEVRYKLAGDKLIIEGGIPGINGQSIEFQYDKSCDELSLLKGMFGGGMDEYAPVWGKEGSFDPNEKQTETPAETKKEERQTIAEKKKTNENQFDRNNVLYVYILNERKAVHLVGEYITGGHNFIVFEDKNGCGSVYSYGPVQSRMDYHARMWTGTFSDFENKIKALSFSLSANRLAVVDSTKKALADIHWKNDFNKYDYIYGSEYCYGTANQPFDRYVKFSITVSEGKKMIDYADLYLSNHPQYGVLVVGKKVGQCDNMTSEIANAGGLGYPVLNTPNLSFDNILNWGEIKKRKFIEQYPTQAGPQLGPTLPPVNK